VRYSIQGLALFALIMALILGARLQPLVRLLEWSPIRWMGRLSYGAYLWHFVALAAVAAAWRAAGLEVDEDAALALRIAYALTGLRRHVGDRGPLLRPGLPPVPALQAAAPARRPVGGGPR
jgi:hypothetical protein